MATEVENIVDPDQGSGWDYDSLSGWESGEQADIVTADEQHTAICRSTSGTDDTLSVVIDGWTTDSTRYIKIWTDPSESHRHAGEWDDSKYILKTTASYRYFTINEDYTRVEGIQFDLTGGYSNQRVNFDADYVQISHCIIKGESGSSSFGIQVGSATDYSLIYNTIVDGGNGAPAGIYCTSYSDIEIYNCTIYSCATGILGPISNYGTQDIKNCAVFDCTDDFDSNGGTTSFTVAYCASDDGDGSNAQTLDSTSSYANEFTDYAGGDVSLVSGGSCVGNGTDDPSSGTYSDDIIETSRTSTWDIGAFEYSAGGGTDVDCSLGTIAVTSNAATISAGSTISGALGTVTVAGLSVDISTGSTVSCSLGQVSVGGLQANISAGTTIECSAGTVAIAGLQSGVSAGNTIAIGIGVVNVASFAASISSGTTIECSAGTLAINGLSATVSNGNAISCGFGEIAVAGLQATISAGKNIDCSTGVISIAGQSADMSAGSTIACSAGTIATTGLQAGISAGRTVSADAGSVVVAGLVAEVDTSGATTVDCATGTVTVSGLPADISAGRTIECSTGALEIAAAEATIWQGTIVDCSAGTLTITSYSADVIQSVVIDCATGEVVTIGYPANMVFTGLAVGAVSITFTATGPSIDFSVKKPTITFTT